jgi:hypothetical protein
MLDGFDQHRHGGKRRSGNHLGDDMGGGAERAVGMRSIESRVTVDRLEGAPEEHQEDAQNAEQQPRSTATTALRQRFGANFHHGSVNIPQVSTVKRRSIRDGRASRLWSGRVAGSWSQAGLERMTPSLAGSSRGFTT